MLERPSRARVACILVLCAAVVAGCSSSDDDRASDSKDEDVEAVTFEVQAPEEITRPSAEGKGVTMPQPAAPVPESYVTEELFVGGTASSFEVDGTRKDGHWSATPSEEEGYRTRVVVRRPASAADFSGTVIVEWFNVSAIESSPDWAFLSKEIVREGHAYIGVSAQAQGIEGGDTLFDVGVDAEDAAEAGVSTDTSGLKNTDPERYGTLVHPGDAYAYDIFAQVGRAASESAEALLGGLDASRVVAVGESQSASFLTTYLNAIHRLDPVFDGFLVHSRGGGAAPIDGDYVSARTGENADAFGRAGIQIRTDLDVPVLLFETETDVTVLGFASARQPDADLVRTWEVAGLAHTDAHLIRSVIGGPRDPSVGDLLGCAAINTGPQHEVLQAALHHVVTWADGGDAPPAGSPLDLTDGGTAIARDDLGIAVGGVRHPLVDVPTTVLSGDPPEGSAKDLGVCFLFGTTTPIDRATLLERYDSFDDYVAQFTASADDAVAAGFLLRPDADALVAEAQANRALFE